MARSATKIHTHHYAITVNGTCRHTVVGPLQGQTNPDAADAYARDRADQIAARIGGTVIKVPHIL